MASPLVSVCSSDIQTKELISLNLIRRGYRVEEIFTEPPKNSDLPPSLIIFDLGSAHSLPHLADYLKRGDRTPVILLVNRAPSRSQIKGLMPILWLEKPLSMDVLMGMVREIVG